MAPSRVIGVDLGGTKLLAGVVDRELRVGHRVRRLLGGLGRAELLDTVAEAVAEARDAAGGEVAAVGLGLPALLVGGVPVFSTHLPIDGVDVAAALGERLGVAVLADNDANLALLAEQRAGAAAGAEVAVLLTLGTGIGGAIMLGGRLVRGAQGAAGELGHVVVDLDGPPCQGKCPSRGCLEALASGTAMEREAALHALERPGSGLAAAAAEGGGAVAGRRVTELALAGDPAAREVVELIGRRLGAGVAGIVNMLNPDIVVIGGGAARSGDLLLDPVRDEVARRALPPSRDHVRVVAAVLGEEAGMVGAGVLALEGEAAVAAR